MGQAQNVKVKESNVFLLMINLPIFHFFIQSQEDSLAALISNILVVNSS